MGAGAALTRQFKRPLPPTAAHPVEASLLSTFPSACLGGSKGERKMTLYDIMVVMMAMVVVVMMVVMMVMLIVVVVVLIVVVVVVVIVMIGKGMGWW